MIPESEAQVERLYYAALMLYLSARWEATTLPEDVQQSLWLDLRDALGLKPGTATETGVGA